MKVDSLTYIFPLTVCVYLHSNFFVVGAATSRKTFLFIKTGVSAFQGHPRSQLLVPIESAGSTSYYSVIVTLVLSCTISEMCYLPHPYSTPILGVFPLHQMADVGCRPEQRP